MVMVINPSPSGTQSLAAYQARCAAAKANVPAKSVNGGTLANLVKPAAAAAGATKGAGATKAAGNGAAAVSFELNYTIFHILIGFRLPPQPRPLQRELRRPKSLPVLLL